MAADIAHQMQKIQVCVFQEVSQADPPEGFENAVEIFPTGGQYARNLRGIGGEFLSAALKVGSQLLLPHRLDRETEGHRGRS